MMRDYIKFVTKSTPVMLLLFSSMYTTMQIFTYLPWMVQHLIPGLDEKDIGYYSGLIAFSQFLGRALSSYLWGYIADRFGRKLVLITSAILLAFSTLGFGFSVTFEMAIIFRFSVGLLNGITSTAKAVISELSNDAIHSFAMGLISATSSIGFVLGCGLSGLLADPILHYSIRPIWVLSKFPFALPGIANAIIIIVAVISVCIFMEDTNKTKIKTVRIEFSEDGQMEDQTTDECNQVLLPKVSEIKVIQFIRSSTLYHLIKSRPTMIAILINSVFHVVITCFEEVLALWVKLTAEFGGLEMSIRTSSVIILMSALISFPISIFLFKSIERFLGGLRTFNLLIIFLIPVFIFLPIISILTNEFITQACLCIFLVVIRAIISGITTGISIFINNSVTQDQLGAVNGLSLSICSIFRAIAPLYGGIVFAASLNNVNFPFNYNLIFVLNGGILILCVVLGSLLPESINRKKSTNIIQELN